MLNVLVVKHCLDIACTVDHMHNMQNLRGSFQAIEDHMFGKARGWQAQESGNGKACRVLEISVGNGLFRRLRIPNAPQARRRTLPGSSPLVR